MLYATQKQSKIGEGGSYCFTKHDLETHSTWDTQQIWLGLAYHCIGEESQAAKRSPCFHSQIAGIYECSCPIDPGPSPEQSVPIAALPTATLMASKNPHERFPFCPDIYM